jgi:apolipoprotein D and lipocalin family protein
MRKFLLPSTLLFLLLGGCVRPPDGVPTVSDFELERYLGTWYEIARLDHSFERGLIDVTADFSRGEDGAIKVVNRGYDPNQERWREAVGRAHFVDDPNAGLLKVSFFGPFYGAYNIIELDRTSYQWALVCGSSRDYLWILARYPELPPRIRSSLVARARELGFSTEELILVPHQR